jgi:hypothetical protein
MPSAGPRIAFSVIFLSDAPVRAHGRDDATMTPLRRKRSGSFKKPTVHEMPKRRATGRRIRFPEIHFPKIRVDIMSLVIALMVMVNLMLVAFGIRQCGIHKDESAVPALSAVTTDTLKAGVPPVARPVQAEEAKNAPLQIEVLNGCGAPGIADKFTAFLRRKGFDVVKTGNYESYNVPKTLVIDRKGKARAAAGIGNALGLKKSEVISEIHELYMVDATVVLGKDFRRLTSWKTMEKKSAKK